MDQSSSSQQPFSKFPPKVYQLILAKVAEIRHLAIEYIRDLPSNGQSRSNKQLADFLTLDKFTQQSLDCVTWKRVGIFSIEHDDLFSYQRDLERSFKQLKKRMKEFRQRFEAQKHHVKSLEFLLIDSPNYGDCSIEIGEELLPYAIKIFNRVPSHQIEEVQIHFAHKQSKSYKRAGYLDYNQDMFKLLSIIPAFQNLMSVQITSEPEEGEGRLDRSLLAKIFECLPIVQSIGLYRIESYYKDYHCKDDTDYKGHNRLGKALASRRFLKTLNLYYFTGPSKGWLRMNWLAPLEELTVMFTPLKMAKIVSRRISPYVRFISLFHRTLVSLHLTETNSHHKLRSEEKFAALKFKSLKHLTYSGKSDPFTSVPFCALLPCVESLYLIGNYIEFQDWKGLEFRRTKSGRIGTYWPALKQVFQSTNTFQSEFDENREHIQKHSVEYSWASLRHGVYGVLTDEPSGSARQEFLYPHAGFRARLGLEHLDRL